MSSPAGIRRTSQQPAKNWGLRCWRSSPISSDAGAQKSLADELRQALGGLDVLFVNAGAAELRPLEQWDEAGFDRLFAVNFKGPFFLIQALLPLFGESGINRA